MVRGCIRHNVNCTRSFGFEFQSYIPTRNHLSFFFPKQPFTTKKVSWLPLGSHPKSWGCFMFRSVGKLSVYSVSLLSSWLVWQLPSPTTWVWPFYNAHRGNTSTGLWVGISAPLPWALSSLVLCVLFQDLLWAGLCVPCITVPEQIAFENSSAFIFTYSKMIHKSIPLLSLSGLSTRL